MAFDYADVVRRCGQKDRQALRSLFDEEAGRLVTVAMRIVRRRDLAEEVVQDSFIRIWQAASSFDPAAGSARGWIYTIVRNRALNVIRDSAREDLVDADSIDRSLEAQAITIDAFDKLASDGQLRRCLEQLDKQKREGVLLSYVAGYSHGEIAGLMGVPIGTAKAWVRRGVAFLKECMT